MVLLNQIKKSDYFFNRKTSGICFRLAIGIYYFRDAGVIKSELAECMKQAFLDGEEFLLNEGILSMMKKGLFLLKELLQIGWTVVIQKLLWRLIKKCWEF